MGQPIGGALVNPGLEGGDFAYGGDGGGEDSVGEGAQIVDDGAKGPGAPRLGQIGTGLLARTLVRGRTDGGQDGAESILEVEAFDVAGVGTIDAFAWIHEGIVLGGDPPQSRCAGDTELLDAPMDGGDGEIQDEELREEDGIGKLKVGGTVEVDRMGTPEILDRKAGGFIGIPQFETPYIDFGECAGEVLVLPSGVFLGETSGIVLFARVSDKGDIVMSEVADDFLKILGRSALGIALRENPEKLAGTEYGIGSTNATRDELGIAGLIDEKVIVALAGVILARDGDFLTVNEEGPVQRDGGVDRLGVQEIGIESPDLTALIGEVVTIHVHVALIAGMIGHG